MSDFFTDEERAVLFSSKPKKIKRLIVESKYNVVVNFTDGKSLASKYVTDLPLPKQVISIMDSVDLLSLYAKVDFKSMSPDSIESIIGGTQFINSAEGISKKFSLPLWYLMGDSYGPQLTKPKPVSMYLPDGRVYFNSSFDDKGLALQTKCALEVFIKKGVI